MEDPVSEISRVIHSLTQTNPPDQLVTIHKYFTPEANFTHPFVSTGSWNRGNGLNSRWAIAKIYRWYKIMSPHIVMKVTSVAYDKAHRIMYVGISQDFRIWPLVPLGYRADVSLVTKLQLVQGADRKYRIQSQEDLYQTTEFAKFVWFGLWKVVRLWQFLSALFCVILAYIGTPISWAEEKWNIGVIKSLPKEDEIPDDSIFIE